MQGVERYKVKLLPYDKAWATEFIEVKAQIEGLWGDNVVDIQHIGSTAVLGAWAKPILDVAVVLKSYANMDVTALTKAGYDFCGLQKPDNDRYLFVLRGEKQISLRHIHCYEENNRDFINCVAFRDYLNAHPVEVEEYSAIKKALADKYADDRVAYTTAKEDFINGIYAKIAHNES